MSLFRNFWLLAAGLAAVLACNGRKVGDHEKKLTPSFSLRDFYGHSRQIDSLTDQLMEGLRPDMLAGQMIFVAAGRLGKPTAWVERQIAAGRVGGVLLLNGSVDSFKRLRARFDSVAANAGVLPLIYSADAEPSLINRKIRESTPVPKTIDLKSVKECRATAEKISNVLNEIGIQQGYAPVVDISDANVVISNRSFGSNPDSIDLLAGVFIKTLQGNGIIATAKHFPGHGLVKGDSHTGLVYIDGPLKEVSVYPPLIKEGLLSIMIGHIAVKNNSEWGTEGFPATCSRRIVTDLLKDQLGFRGLVVTDAMNMGALKAFPNAPLLAVRAGCDVILMPGDEEKLESDIIREMQKDHAFRRQVENSVRKIIKMKICLGLIKSAD